MAASGRLTNFLVKAISRTMGELSVLLSGNSIFQKSGTQVRLRSKTYQIRTSIIEVKLFSAEPRARGT